MITDRRVLLGAGIALPAWLSLGFQATPKQSEAAPRLQSAIDRARRVGKPLLVLIAPREEVPARTRGELWGHYFANLSDAQALDLALCEVTCARVSDIAAALPTHRLDGVDDSTWAVLLETEVDPTRSVLVKGKLPNAGSLRQERGDWMEELPNVRSGLEELLRAAILPDEASQSLRLAQCRAVIPSGSLAFELDADDPRARFDGITTTPPIRRGDLDRWAAIVRFVQVPDQPNLPDEIRNLYKSLQPWLADAVRIRLFESTPDGATWMLHSMDCPPCGMGFVPPTSRFFLKFLTQ